MLKLRALVGLATCCAILAAWPEASSGQGPAVVTYYPAQPVVTYVPRRAGLFGLRRVWRPTITYAPAATVVSAAPAPATTYYAPAPAVTYSVAPAPVTTYYAPPPVTTYYVPPPVTVYYAPVIVP